MYPLMSDYSCIRQTEKVSWEDKEVTQLKILLSIRQFQTDRIIVINDCRMLKQEGTLNCLPITGFIKNFTRCSLENKKRSGQSRLAYLLSLIFPHHCILQSLSFKIRRNF